MRAASCKTCFRRKATSTRVFAKRCPGWALRIWCVKALAVCDPLELDSFSLIPHDPQVIPELKLQVTELQKQKQELEAHVHEQRSELAGKYQLFFNISATFELRKSTTMMVFMLLLSVLAKRKISKDHR